MASKTEIKPVVSESDTRTKLDSQNVNTHKRRRSLHRQNDDDTEHEHDGKPPEEAKKKHAKATFMEKVREFCTTADMFATEHVWPIHILCIVVASAIIPVTAVAVVWDLLSADIFEIADLSTINTPAFVLVQTNIVFMHFPNKFINFIAMPLAMYGYMMEYLMHEHSKLAIIALICVVVHPILFSIRALIEYLFDGYRGEEKIYFEGFDREGQEHKYPIGLIRYRQGDPFSDSDEGKTKIKETYYME